MNRYAVIPARGGSRRIPRKNIREFCGRPVIAYAIDNARLAGCFDEVIVSTDDQEIAAVAREHGARTPFTRPPELADDVTGTNAVIAHAARYLKEQGRRVEAICGLYPAAPLLRPEDILSGLALLRDSDADYVISVSEYAHPIERALRLGPEGQVEMLWPQHRLTRTQDLEPACHDAGQMYWGRFDAFLEERPLFSLHSRGLLLPRERAIDIDTPEDWELAEAMYRVLQDRERNA